MDDELIRRWQTRVSAATTDALAELAAHEVSPFSDGVLGQWIRSVAGVRLADVDVPAIVALIGKADPHLQEAGVVLATTARSTLSQGVRILDAAITELLARGEPDAWVVEALVGYLAHAPTARPSEVPIYEALARLHKTVHERGSSRRFAHAGADEPGRLAIHRNRYIEPWTRLVRDVYEQKAMQTLLPTPRDLAVLPILERVHDTRGWDATVRAVLRGHGFDPDEHVARLRQLGR